jgi:hypothetical protein
MRLDYRDHQVIRAATERELALRHLHARTLDEARLDATSIGTHPEPRLFARITAAIRSPWRGRGRSVRDLGRVQGTIAAAAMAVPVIALDAVPVEPTTPTLPIASVDIALEMTGSTCRLPDGSVGRIAIRHHSDDDWAAVCVQFTPEALPSAT